MSDMADLKCTTCDIPVERVRYFPRQLLTADDLAAEQGYHREKVRRHLRYLHGWGVVCGCSVEQSGKTAGWQVRVSPGYAVSPMGDEIFIDDTVEVDLRLGVQSAPCAVQPCPPLGEPAPARDGRATAYIAVRSADCYSRPVRVHPAGCGCDETSCEYSRVREVFEIKVLWALPASHQAAAQQDLQWGRMLENLARDHQKELVFPVPPCPDCASDPWVVLATISLPQKQTTDGKGTNDALQISYKDRRVLLSTQRLQIAMLSLAERDAR